MCQDALSLAIDKAADLVVQYSLCTASEGTIQRSHPLWSIEIVDSPIPIDPASPIAAFSIDPRSLKRTT